MVDYSAVPIYDSVAVKALKKYYRRAKPDPRIIISAAADRQYTDFVMRFWLLYQDAKESGVPFNVKLLDNFLLAPATDSGK